VSATQHTIHEHLRERFDHIFVDPDDGEVAVPIGFPGASIWLRVHVKNSRDFVAVASNFPVTTPQCLFAAMSEYLLCCSEGLCSGGFQLDFDDGSVLFRTSQFHGGTTLEKQDVSHLVEMNLRTARAAIPGMLAVAYGGVELKDAVGLPAWPERVLDQDLSRTLEKILGTKSEPSCASDEAETAGSPASAGSPESSAMVSAPAPVTGEVQPGPAEDGDDKARMLDRLQDRCDGSQPKPRAPAAMPRKPMTMRRSREACSAFPTHGRHDARHAGRRAYVCSIQRP